MAAKSCGILHRNKYLSHFGVNENGLPSEESRPFLQVTPLQRLEQGSFSLNHFIQGKAAILLARNSESVIALEAIML
jgi:hypothetical protein